MAEAIPSKDGPAPPEQQDADEPVLGLVSGVPQQGTTGCASEGMMPSLANFPYLSRTAPLIFSFLPVSIFPPAFYDSKTIEVYGQKKGGSRLCGKKSFQGSYGLRIHPALDLLTPPLHADEAGLAQFFYVMGNGGGHNTQILTQFAHTGASFSAETVIDGSDRSWLTT
jgi:hypothetical protein